MPRRVRLKVIGDGGANGALRVALPTYTMVSINYATKIAVVEIPDEDYPDSPPADGSADAPILNGVPTLIRVGPIARAQWRAKLRQRYRDATAEIDPDSSD